jgi:hypothetical protein
MEASLRNKRIPEYGEPAIVTGVLPRPLYEQGEASAASPYYMEPLTIIIGIFMDDDLVEFYVDARRFEPMQG